MDRRQLDRNQRGFTLIELLVVISIIALLVSILLPALSQSRLAARHMESLARMRGIATGLHMYTLQAKGKYPEVAETSDFADTWMGRIVELIPGDHENKPTVFRSPLDTNDEPMWNGNTLDGERKTSYALNAYAAPSHPPFFGLTFDQVAMPSQFILINEVQRDHEEDHFTPQFWGSGTPFFPITGNHPVTGEAYDYTDDRDENWDDAEGKPKAIGARIFRNKGNYAFADGHAASLDLGEVFEYAGSGNPTIDQFYPKRSR